MTLEPVGSRDDVLIRRLILEPGEATFWHTDLCDRFTVVVRGSLLTIEFEDSTASVNVSVRPGLVGWDAPEPRSHRALNSGADVYEEVVVFFGRAPGQEPQPRQDR